MVVAVEGFHLYINELVTTDRSLSQRSPLCQIIAVISTYWQLFQVNSWSSGKLSLLHPRLSQGVIYNVLVTLTDPLQDYQQPAFSHSGGIDMKVDLDDHPPAIRTDSLKTENGMCTYCFPLRLPFMLKLSNKLDGTRWIDFKAKIFKLSALRTNFFDRINKINKIFFCFYPEHPV